MVWETKDEQLASAEERVKRSRPRHERRGRKLSPRRSYGIKFLRAVLRTRNRPSPVLVTTTMPLSKYG